MVKTHLRLFSGTSVETAIAGNPSMPAFLDALTTTETLFARIRSRIGSRAAFALLVCDDTPPINEDLQKRLHNAGFTVIPGIGEALAKARNTGLEIYANDNSHWSEEGNRVVGQVVTGYLSTSFFPTGSPQ